MRATGALISLVFALMSGEAAATDARASDTVCWIQNGVLLVPAVAAGVNGVFILDTGAARSQIDATQASEADIGDGSDVGPTIKADVRVAGRTFRGASLAVLALDNRTRAFPTPIAGVLGSDLLTGLAVEIDPNPCRIRLMDPKRGRSRRGDLQFPLEMRDGAPYVRAAVSDGVESAAGLFEIDTGAPIAATLRPAAGVKLVANRLRALSIGGALFENITAAPFSGAADDASDHKELGRDGGGKPLRAFPHPALGAIGEPIWSRFRVRLDYAARTLFLSNPSDRRCARCSYSWRKARRRTAAGRG